MSKLSGKKALAEIDTMLAAARDRLAETQRQYARARSRLAELQHEEIGIYAGLAKLRLLAIESGELIDALSSADRRVADVLKQRETAAQRLDATIESANRTLGEQEARRAAQHETVNAASEALDVAQGDAQSQLAADAHYQEQLSVTEKADFVADQAEDKAASAQRDRVEKGKPYEDDALFSYLHERGYGTLAYRAWPLTRWLDGRVASLCGYEAARRDYALLTEIPARLAEHAAAMRAAFEREVESLRAMETTAAEAAQVPERSAELDKQQAKLAEIDAEISAQEDRLRELVRERVRFSNGSDEFYTRCIGLLSDAMRRQGFTLLRERAARTPDPEDDAMVHRLTELNAEIERLQQDLSDFRHVFERESRRGEEFEDMRRQFKQARFDDSRSEFLDAALFTLVLERFLNGSVSSKDAWKAIRRQQRTRAAHADPRFGTGRFPRARRKGPWRWPPGGGGFGGGGFGGGGFGSGGGFGGGGFKTGGGF